MSGFNVLALRADDSGCAKYRIKEPARAINAAHPEIQITVDTSVEIDGDIVEATGIVTKVHEIKTDADLIVLQRPLRQWFYPMVIQAHKQGIAVVVELDDDFVNVHRKNAVWSDVQPFNHAESNYEWLQKTAHIADWVTVSTPALMKYALNGNGSVVPNYIASHDVSTEDHQVTGAAARIGWTGTTQTHPTDLQITGGSINQVLRDTGSTFSVVGDDTGVRDALSIAKALQVRSTGWVPTDEYMNSMAKNIDIGIVPLDDTEFNRCKSNLKGLEFAACGVPFVATGLPEYARLASRGVGEIASTPSEWRRSLTKLTANADLRAVTGDAYRTLIKQDWLIEDHVEEWVTAWRHALDARGRIN